MKKLLLGSFALLFFAVSLLIFDISCKKEALAQTNTITVTQSGLMFYETTSGGIGVENYDGTNAHELPIVLPAGLEIAFAPNVSISPDRKTIFFGVQTKTGVSGGGGYACNIDGTNVHQVDQSNYHVAF